MANRGLLDEIKREHLAISQFVEGSRVYPSNFSTRNRTMALISDATFIIEAGEKSGTQHQAWEALRLNRELYISKSILDQGVRWPEKAIPYGAYIMEDDEFESIVAQLPSYTSWQADHVFA